MEPEPVKPKPASSEAGHADALSAFVLSLREALLGLPSSSLPADAADLKAELSRLQALARRLEAREADLEKAQKQLLGPWQRLVDEALPKLKARLDAGGLRDVFEFQGLLEEVRRRLSAAPPAVLPEGLQAQEVARLQAEVIRLLELRRRGEAEAPPLKSRIADLEAQVQAAQEQLTRLAREGAELRAERDRHARDAELARRLAAEAEWQKTIQAASAQSLESRHFQDQFAYWRDRIAALEREVEEARQATLAAAQEAALARDDLGRAIKRSVEQDAERKRLSEAEEKARSAAGRLEAAAAAAERELGALREHGTAQKAELAALQSRLAGARAEADHERTLRLELSEAVRRLEEQVAAGARVRAELEPRLERAVHDAAERAMELEKAKARLSLLDESNAQRTVQLELSTRKLLEESETAKRLAAALEQVERAHRALEANAQGAAESASLHAERLAAERDRAAQALEQALSRLGRLEQEAGFARHAERAAIDRSVEAETRARQLDARRNQLEGELAHAREEQDDLKRDADRLSRELHASQEALAAADAAQRESLRLTQGLAGEVEALRERLTNAEKRLADARADADRRLGESSQALAEASRREAKLGIELEGAEREVKALRVDLAQREAALALERKARSELEDEVAQDRARLGAEAARLRAQADASTVVRPSEPPRTPAPPAVGIDGLDAALRTLLGTLESSLTVVRAAAGASGGSRPVLQNVHGELAVAQDQLRALVEYFRSPLPAAPRDLAPIIDTALKGWAPALRGRRIEVDRRIAAKLPPCRIQPERLTLVAHQLLRNAHEAMPDGGKLEVELSLEGDDLVLLFRDTGHGIPADVLADPTRPFRRAGPGHLGLGLALAHRVAAAVGGELKLANLPQAGAEVKLSLPRYVPPTR